MKDMLVKLDENMAQNHVEFLRQAGYDADKVLIVLSRVIEEQPLTGLRGCLVVETRNSDKNSPSTCCVRL